VCGHSTSIVSELERVTTSDPTTVATYSSKALASLVAESLSEVPVSTTSSITTFSVAGASICPTRRLAFGVWRLAFGVWRLAFGLVGGV
jgi:hypothetical protein